MSAFDPRLKRKYSKREIGTTVGALGLAPSSAFATHRFESAPTEAQTPLRHRSIAREAAGPHIGVKERPAYVAVADRQQSLCGLAVTTAEIGTDLRGELCDDV